MAVVVGRWDSGNQAAPQVQAWAGGSVEIAGWMQETTLVLLKASIQQLNGYLGNPDEPVVPCTFSHDANLDGFYVVTDVSISAVLGTTYAGAFAAGYTVSLQRVVGYGSPYLEVVTQSVLRTNDHGITTPTTIIAALLPATVSEFSFGSALSSATAVSRTASDGQIISAYRLAGPTAKTQYSQVVTPSTFYAGGCTVEYHDGADYRIAVGRDIPLSRLWRISNGIITLTSANGATAGSISIWDGSTSDSQNVAHVTDGAVGPGIGLGNGSTQPTVNILENSPHQVRVQCRSFGAGGSVAFTYRLQRGAHIVECSWVASAATKYGAGFPTTIATTAVATDQAIEQTTAVAGNKLVFGTAKDSTRDNTNGRINVTTATTTGSMFIGVVLNSASVATGNAAAALIDQFHGVTKFVPKLRAR